ncbi:MAG TPA: hypothetical protein VFZ80_05700 [Acidimicrobiia bacterium]
MIGSLAWGLYSYGELQDRLDELPRTLVPGVVDVEVDEPQTLTVFYEDPASSGTFAVQSGGSNTLTAPPVELAVSSPSGQEVDVLPYERDLRFDHEGRVLTAISTFSADSAGIYIVEVEGDVPASARVSVGRVVESSLVATVIGVVGSFVLSVIGLLIAVVALSIRRATGVATPGREPLVRV